MKQSELQQEAVARYSRLMWQFGPALFVFLFLAGMLSLQANLSVPVRLDEGPLLVGLVLFLAYTGYWTIALLRAFRVPSSR